MESLLSSRVAVGVVALTVLYLLRRVQKSIQWRTRSKGRPLPPGPKGLPIIGNLLDIPTVRPWLRYREYTQQYGELTYFDTMGERMLLVGSPKATFDLLDKRSANYSDRPNSIVWQMLGSGWFFPMMPYGPWWRAHRREFWQHFHPGVVDKYDPIQQQEVFRFLNHVVDDPKEFKSRLGHMFSAIILRSVYNLRVADKGDPVIHAMEQAMAGQKASVLPGLSYIDYIPWIRFWRPFQKKFAMFKKAGLSMRDMPFDESLSRPVDDPGYSSVVKSLTERLAGEDGRLSPRDEELVRNVAGVSYAGGGDTTFSTLQTFFLAMSLYPEVQKRAKAELDAKVGRDRLPDFNDRDNLPYINAIVKEALRWQVVSPLGVAHTAVEDDEYNGYFIPAGTAVLANSWAMLHDEEMYPDPMEFKPERFLKDGELDPQVPDPMLFALGYGRRMCPGKHFLDRSIYISVACILSVFDITLPIGADGKPYRIVPSQTTGHLSFPEDCSCTIKPRSEQAVHVIRQNRV